MPTQYKYNKAFPPSVKIADEFGESFQKLVIPTEIVIEDILEISDSKLSVVFMVRMTWRDSHLVFNYLKDEALYNELDEATLSSVWMPDPQFAFLYNGLQEILSEHFLSILFDPLPYQQSWTSQALFSHFWKSSHWAV